MTQDIDRKRIETVADRARRIITDLEHLAVAGATQHDRQVDLLREELAEVNRRNTHAAEVILAGVDDATEPVDMTVGLDDIRALLAEAGQDNPVIGALLVDDGDEVQVVDSIHAIIADVANLTDVVRNARAIAASAQAERDRAIRAAADNANAEADGQAVDRGALKTAYSYLVEALRPIDVHSAALADVANPVAGILIISAAITELAKQVATGGEGETMKALAMARADADRIEDDLHAIETACEAAGMAATVERRDIPAWLAANLKPRAKAKKTAPDDEHVDDGTGWVVMRNDANGRRFYNAPVWGTLDAAAKHITYVAAHDTKPRGAKVVGIVEAQRLVENDARVAASASLPLGDGGSNE